MAATERTRLHITPFNSDLLDRYIPPSLKAAATNISFHSVETFPERGFGYVELPTTDAQKLKMKLNGSTLKGAKVKIEEAKPEKKRKSSDAAEVDVDDKKARKKAKKEKRKKEHGVIPGHELADGRIVKRGWDEKNPARKSAKKDDGSLEGKKLRFKTVLPPNKGEIGDKVKSKDKKDKKERKEKKEKSRKEVVVKEFANTTKPISRAAAAPRKSVSYEEGRGWVDEDGNVVEEEPPQKKRKRSIVAQEAAQAEETEQAANLEPSVEDEISSDSEEANAEADVLQAEQVDEEHDASDSNSSEDDANEQDADDHVDRQLKQAQTNLASNAAVEREQSNSIPIADRLSAELDAASAEDKEVHPLEALFKRPATNAEEAVQAKKPAPIDTSFSFFNSGADDAEDGVSENNPPQTPHTKQDLEWRSVRSAAPTPDTAAIGKRFSFPFAAEDVDGHEEDEDVDMQDTGHDDDDEAEAGAEGSKQGEREESEFRKWFYENRGDLNRSWKKRRREEKKIVRQRENRRLSRRLA